MEVIKLQEMDVIRKGKVMVWTNGELLWWISVDYVIKKVDMISFRELFRAFVEIEGGKLLALILKILVCQF